MGKYLIALLLISSIKSDLFALFGDQADTISDEIKTMDLETSQMFRKIDDKINYLKRRHMSFLRRHRNLQQRAGSMTLATPNAVYGFGWQNGQFMRCQSPEHFLAFSANTNGASIAGPNGTISIQNIIAPLFDRFPMRRNNPNSMQCHLYMKLVRLVRYSVMGMVQLEVHFRSNCIDTVLNKLFIVPFHRKLPNHIGFNFGGVRFTIRTLRTRTEGANTDSRIASVEYRLDNYYVARRNIVNRPETLFGNNTIFTPLPENTQLNLRLPFIQFNTTFSIIPKKGRTGSWLFADIERIWNAPNPQDCIIDQTILQTPMYNMTTTSQVTVPTEAVIIRCQS